MTLPRFGVDTAIWISLFERNPRFERTLSGLLAGVIRGEALAVVSTLAILEVLTGAYRRRDEALAEKYRELFLNTAGVVVVPVDSVIASEGARIRVRYNVATPDALHLATALVSGAPTFLTTDRRLSRVREIDVKVVKPVAGKI